MKPGHVADLLPAYLNGTLADREKRWVAQHLARCAECRAELASWEAVREATRETSKRLPAPPARVMANVWSQIERDEEETGLLPLGSRVALAWQLLLGQLPLVRKEIWIASPLTIAVGCIVGMMTAEPAASGLLLAVLAPVVAAVGVAFVYGPENDPSLEVALSTPTPPRLILMARLTLVYGYDLVLALVATGLLATVKGGLDVWPLISLWVVPMLFLSALSLLLSLTWGTTAAMLATIALWTTKVVYAAGSPETFSSTTGGLGLVEAFWGTNTVLLPLAVVLITVALLRVPSQERLG